MIPPWSRGALFVIALLGAVACSSGGAGGSSETTGGETAAPTGGGEETVADATLAELDGSDLSDVVDPPPEKCTSEAGCAAGEICSCQGACVSAGEFPCVEDKNCGSEAYCDVCVGFCQPLKGACDPCLEDHECAGTGSACLDLLSGERVCGKACLTETACSPGYSCVGVVNVSVDQCVPTSGICAAVGECQIDDDCPFPKICNELFLVCADGCADDAACSDALVCEGGHCVGACDDATNPCPGEQTCAQGHCTIPGGCVDSKDCDAPETHCDLDLHICVDGCQADYDCKNSATVCEEGACVPKACTGNWFCAFGQFCNLTTGGCEDAVGPFCAACDPANDTVCGPAGDGNLCVDFKDENNADLGSYCLVSCAQDPANGCPQGYACTEVDTGEAAPQLLCTRDCPVPPVGAPAQP